MNQHYVPRLYLKRFTQANDQIFVYDKFSRTSFGPTNITKVASEKNFYNVAFKDDVATDDLNPKFTEDQLASLESKFNDAIEAAIRVAEGGEAGLEERADMSLLVTMQWLRTRAARNRLTSMMRLLTEASLNSALDLAAELAGDSNQYKDIKVETKKQSKVEEAGMHSAHLWNIEFLQKVAESLFNRIWLLGINQTSAPLLTSDNPVVLQAHKPISSFIPSPNEVPAFYKAIDITVESDIPGIGEEGVEVVFPLTPRYALIIFEETFFSDLERFQGRRIPLNLEMVQNYNELQVLQSYRQIYSNRPNWKLMEKMYKEHPEAFDPHRETTRMKRWKWT